MMTLEVDVAAALAAAADDSWTVLDRADPLVLTKRPGPGTAFVANIVIMKMADGPRPEANDGVLFATLDGKTGIVHGHDIRISVERGVTITQEQLTLTRDSETVGVTSSAAGSDVRPTADLIALLVRGLNEEEA